MRKKSETSKDVVVLKSVCFLKTDGLEGVSSEKHPQLRFCWISSKNDTETMEICLVCGYEDTFIYLSVTVSWTLWQHDLLSRYATEIQHVSSALIIWNIVLMPQFSTLLGGTAGMSVPCFQTSTRSIGTEAPRLTTERCWATIFLITLKHFTMQIRPCVRVAKSQV